MIKITDENIEKIYKTACATLRFAQGLGDDYVRIKGLGDDFVRKLGAIYREHPSYEEVEEKFLAALCVYARVNFNYMWDYFKDKQYFSAINLAAYVRAAVDKSLSVDQEHQVLNLVKLKSQALLIQNLSRCYLVSCLNLKSKQAQKHIRRFILDIPNLMSSSIQRESYLKATYHVCYCFLASFRGKKEDSDSVEIFVDEETLDSDIKMLQKAVDALHSSADMTVVEFRSSLHESDAMMSLETAVSMFPNDFSLLASACLLSLLEVFHLKRVEDCKKVLSSQELNNDQASPVRLKLLESYDRLAELQPSSRPQFRAKVANHVLRYARACHDLKTRRALYALAYKCFNSACQLSKSCCKLLQQRNNVSAFLDEGIVHLSQALFCLEGNDDGVRQLLPIMESYEALYLELSFPDEAAVAAVPYPQEVNQTVIFNRFWDLICLKCFDQNDNELMKLKFNLAHHLRQRALFGPNDNSYYLDKALSIFYSFSQFRNINPMLFLRVKVAILEIKLRQTFALSNEIITSKVILSKALINKFFKDYLYPLLGIKFQDDNEQVISSGDESNQDSMSKVAELKLLSAELLNKVISYLKTENIPSHDNRAEAAAAARVQEVQKLLDLLERCMSKIDRPCQDEQVSSPKVRVM